MVPEVRTPSASPPGDDPSPAALSIPPAWPGSRASWSRGPPGSWARPWSNASCARSPTARWSSSSGPPDDCRRPSGPGERSSATTASTASGSSGATVRRPGRARLVAVAGDVSRDGLGLDDEGRPCWPRATSSSTRPPPSPSTPPSTPPSRSTCWARRGWPPPSPRWPATGSRPTRTPPHPSGHRLDRLRGRHPPG
jgi:hypothetical protein